MFFPTVNYRGSLGFGQDSVASLPGNVGTQDVHDVQVWPQHMVLGDPILLWVPPRRKRAALMGVPCGDSSVWSGCYRRNRWMLAGWHWWVALMGAFWHATSLASSLTPTMPVWFATLW